MKKTPILSAALALVVGGIAGCNSGDKPAGDTTKTGEGKGSGATTEGGKAALQAPKGDSDIIPVGSSYTKGPADALITVVEFSEFQCPFCTRVNPTIKELQGKYGDKIRIVFKHNPLPFHKEAPLAAQYALAAGKQGKFWEMHDKMFENQRALQPADLDKYAGELGLNLDQLKKDAQSEEIQKAVKDDMALAAKVGARGTPNFLINGKQLSGAQPVASFTALIDEELKAAEALVEKGTAKTDVYAARVKENFKAPTAQPGEAPANDKTVYKIPAGTSYAKGPADALVTIIEFSEFQCPFCTRVNPTIKQIQDTYKDDVRIVFKHNPLPFHKEAPGAAFAALAAGEQGKFWEMHDKLFENQRALQPADLEKYAGELGLDMAKFKADMESDKIKAAVAEDQKLAAQFGANGTPNFFINGRQLVGARPFESFKEVIDEELKKAKDVVAKGTPRSDVYAAVTKDGKDKAAAPAPRQPSAQAEDTTVYKVPVNSGDAIKGSNDALVTIVEFSEFQCPFCSRVNPTIKEIQGKYGDKVRIVFKHNPLPFHKEAPLASQFALAAGKQGKFWEMHDKLFENQRALQPADLEKYAGELGLDLGKLKADAESEEIKKQVQADMDLARQIGAGGTPNFFINGRKLVGAQPFASFEKVIDEQLKKAEAEVAKGTAKSAVYDALIKDGATKPSAPAGPPPEDDTKVFEVKVNSEDMFKGPANAPITIVEFSEFQCPFCSRVNPTIKEIQDKYGDKVKIVFKHNPLSFHQDAPLAAEASLAAGAQGKFWPMHDLLFQNQRALKREDLEKYGQEIGLNMDKFKADLDSGKFKAQIQADMAEAQKHGASGTPSFFINGRKLRGAQPFASFERLINEELKKLGK